ncbi:TonB-dependent receptor [Terriglobus tenax]|uniref:TonB-dependent receptor n=1 Tax=Terriglobus tenax TaxID=1111115 RepID=UPI0021E00329|nr:carboxypeptidase regulatory-like domain-containing protein [Terriglobus tenax]
MRKLFTLLVCLISLSVAGLAQFDTGAVLGSVTDEAKLPVSDAKITLEDVNRGTRFSIVSDASGVFQFPSVPIGRYHIRTEHAGFGAQVSQDFDLTIGSRQRVDFQLHAEQVLTVVDVQASVPLVQIDSSDRGQTIGSAQIRELPLNGRYYSDLVLLSTGVMRSPSSYGTSSSFREGSFNVNGLRSTTNNFVLDGLDNNYFGTSNQGFANQVVQPPPDAIAEFRLITNNQPAEYGRSGGGTIIASLRSGTNQFHGTVWEFIRNTEFNANGYFKASNGKPRLNRNQFGFTFGGPIWKDKTFFFTDYEGYREVSSTVASATLPTISQRQGSLGVPVRNPYTGALYADGRIPSTDIIRFASTVLAALPALTSATSGANYTSLYRITDRRNKGDIRIDHYMSDKIRIFGRYDQSQFNVFDPGLITGLAGGGGNGTQIVPIQAMAAGLTWTISDRTLLDVGFGYSQSSAGKSPPLAGGPSMLDLFGIPGLPTDPAYTGGISSETLIGFSALGRQATSPQFQHPKLYDPKINLTHIFGTHTLKAGAEYQWLGVRTLDVNPILGRDVYSALFSAPAVGTLLPNGSTVTAAQISANQALYSLADFLYGARNQYQLVNPGYVNHRQQAGFFYAQDDWKLHKTLTLNLGLRYELVTPFYEKDNLLSNYDPVSNSMILAKSGSIYDRALVNMDTNNFAPRIGASWSVSPSTVVHGGFSMGYINTNRTGTSYLAYNAPRFILATVTQSDPRASSFRTTQQGFPADFTSSATFNPRASTVQYIPRDTPSGQVQSYYVSVQRQLPYRWLIDVGYVGNNGKNLIIINDINQARPNALNENTNVELRRPNQAFSSIAATLPYGTSSYNGLQIRLEKQASKGFYFLNSFTWSKTLDIASQAFDSNNGNGTSVQNINNVQADHGISNYNRPFNNVTSVVYELPFGRGRSYLANTSRLLDYALGGWDVNTIVNMRSGEPFTLSYTANAQQQVVPVLSVLGRNSYRPDVSGSVLAPEGTRSPTNYLNRANVSVPLYYSPFGNSGRNTVRGYAFYQTDLGISKRFPITERIGLLFRAEAFNLFNRSNFAAPDGNISNATFGVITSTYPPRQLQFALKVQF